MRGPVSRGAWTGALGLAAACSASSTLARGDAGPIRDGDRACRAAVSLRAEESVWAELRERGGAPPAFQSRVPAAVIDPSVQAPVRAAASLTVDGRAVAWFAAPLDAVVFDGAAFAPLRGVDVTRLPARGREVVGRVMPRAREQLGERGVVELLLRAEVLRSYWGRGVELCLRRESTVSGSYRASWRAAPRGASRRSGDEGIYAFVVEIDAEGEVSVIGEPASSRSSSGDPQGDR